MTEVQSDRLAGAPAVIMETTSIKECHITMEIRLECVAEHVRRQLLRLIEPQLY